MTEIKFSGASSGAPPPVAREVTMDPEPNGEVEGSLLSQLRIKAKAQQKQHTTDMVVGGEFKKQLWIRYQPLEPAAMDRYITRRAEIRERQESNPRMGLPYTELNMDLMAQACVAVVGADENGENKFVLEDDTGSMRLEHRLAVMLGMPVPGDIELNARDVIKLVFGGNALAIVDHGDDLLTWLRDPAKGKVDAGES